MINLTFPSLLIIFNQINEAFPELLGYNENDFSINCLNQIEESFHIKKNFINSTPIEDISYYLFKLIILHCLNDGNKRLFSTFFIEFLEINNHLIHETWSNLELNDQIKYIINLCPNFY